MNICSGVWAWATMRISSSTANTLAMPARKIAWLSARISLSIRKHSLSSGVANKFVMVNHTGNATRVGAAVAAGCGLVSSNHAAAALNFYVLLATGDFRGQSDFEFNSGTNL